MSVVIETTLGDITVDLFIEERPQTCLNFLKLCKIKYYNLCLFHSVCSNFLAQTGDPTGKGDGGESIFGVLKGEQHRLYQGEKLPKIKHDRTGLVSMVSHGDGMFGSQFVITLSEDLGSLDQEHCVFGHIVEGAELLLKLNEAITDDHNRPYQDIRITHTVILDDPFPDPEGLIVPPTSPVPPNPKDLAYSRIPADEPLTEKYSPEELDEMVQQREAAARAAILEMVGDIPDADIAPPENVLFVCKLNPVTSDHDLSIIFSRFGTVKSCEVIRDKVTGDSLQYAFVEFEDRKACEDAYFKMDNVLIDDRRIHVDFSQSVAKIRWKGKGRIEYLGPPPPGGWGARQKDSRQNDSKQRDSKRRDSKQRDSRQRESKQRDSRQRESNQRDSRQRDSKHRDSRQRESNQRDSRQSDSKQKFDNRRVENRKRNNSPNRTNREKNSMRNGRGFKRENNRHYNNRNVKVERDIKRRDKPRRRKSTSSSSSSDSSESSGSSSSSESSDDKRKKHKSSRKVLVVVKTPRRSRSRKKIKKTKGKTKKGKSESDSDSDDSDIPKKKRKKPRKSSSSSSSSSSSDSSSDEIEKKKRKRKASSSSEDEPKAKQKKKRGRESSDSSTEDENIKKKSKNRKRKTSDNSSSDSEKDKVKKRRKEKVKSKKKQKKQEGKKPTKKHRRDSDDSSSSD